MTTVLGVTNGDLNPLLGGDPSTVGTVVSGNLRNAAVRRILTATGTLTTVGTIVRTGVSSGSAFDRGGTAELSDRELVREVAR